MVEEKEEKGVWQHFEVSEFMFECFNDCCRGAQELLK